MASGHNDPKLLYSITGVSAYHIANGVEESLTPAGPQTLSLLMVPAASAFADQAVDGHQQPGDQPPEEDFYLHLHLPPELDLPLPATTQIYHQPPTSYLIPRWDMGPNSGVFTRIEFPAVGSRKGLQEDVDTFETILAQCTAFLERSPPPKIAGKKSAAAAAASRHHHTGKGSASTSASRSAPVTEELPPYNPGNFQPGEAYAKGSPSSQAGGQIVLVDEEDGSVIGELGEGFKVVEDQTLKPGSKDPVQITLPTDAVPSISVAPATAEDMEMSMHPAYRKSFLVNNAAAASRLIVATSEVVSRTLQSQADNFARKAQPTNKPITFQPSTHQHVRRINTFSAQAAGLSAKAAVQVGKVAQNLGASLAGHKGKGNHKGFGPDGQPLENYKPGLLNKSLMAFSTVADGVEQAGRHLLDSSSTAATTVVTHKWGPEAGEVTKNLGGGIKNVGLVYIDVTGVSRRALIKSVAKGMVVGRVPGGGELIVGGDDGNVVSVPGGSKSSSRTGSIRESSASTATTAVGVDGKRSTVEFSDNNPYKGR